MDADVNALNIHDPAKAVIIQQITLDEGGAQCGHTWQSVCINGGNLNRR